MTLLASVHSSCLYEQMFKTIPMNMPPRERSSADMVFKRDIGSWTIQKGEDDEVRAPSRGDARSMGDYLLRLAQDSRACERMNKLWELIEWNLVADWRASTDHCSQKVMRREERKREEKRKRRSMMMFRLRTLREIFSSKEERLGEYLCTFSNKVSAFQVCWCNDRLGVWVQGEDCSSEIWDPLYDQIFPFILFSYSP